MGSFWVQAAAPLPPPDDIGIKEAPPHGIQVVGYDAELNTVVRPRISWPYLGALSAAGFSLTFAEAMTLDLSVAQSWTQTMPRSGPSRTADGAIAN